MRKHRLGTSTAMLLLLAACGGGEGGPSHPGFTFDDLPDGGPRAPGDDEDFEPIDDPSALDLLEERVAGHYALKLVIASIAKVPPLGSERASTTTSLSLGEIRRVDNGFVLVERGCRATSSDKDITLPDTLTRSVEQTTVPIGFADDQAGVTRFVRLENLVLVGVRLDNPETETLPSDGSDPRVFDQDEDGHPGVTVKKSGFPSGDIYVVQRQRSSYAGAVKSDGLLEGNVVNDVEQKVIGASSSLLKIDVPSWQDPDLSKSTVKMVRLDEKLTCDALVAQAGALFGS